MGLRAYMLRPGSSEIGAGIWQKSSDPPFRARAFGAGFGRGGCLGGDLAVRSSDAKRRGRSDCQFVKRRRSHKARRNSSRDPRRGRASALLDKAIICISFWTRSPMPVYNAVHMPAASRLPSALDRQLLIQLGERLRRARQEQGLTTVALAERAGISRMTLGAVEAGEPAPTMGTYLRVMSALGVAGDLALVATGELRGNPLDAAEPKIELDARNAPHEIQDLQSLLLHEEAVRLLRQQPELISSALDILEKWRASGSANSRPLLDEWSVILHRRDWRRILARTRRSKELRQASPLTVLLPSQVRERVLEDVRALKGGVTLGHLRSASRPRGASPKGGK